MRERRQKRGNVKADEIIESFDEHIKSFPFKVAHYENCGREFRYLSSELPIWTMYEMYFKQYNPCSYLVLKNEDVDVLSKV